MDDGAALRAAVRANRGQATPRLVYADWLDDNGDPVGAALQRVLARPDDDGMRLAYADAVEADGKTVIAKFIRHQIEHKPPHWNVPLTRLLDLEPLVGPYPHRYHTNTSSADGAVVDYHSFTFGYRRGFVEIVGTSSFLWLAHADAITEAHPVRRVRLTTTPPYSQRNDYRERVTAIWFHGREDARYGVNNREMALLGGYRHAANMMRDAVLGLLRLNWPDIEFELPPVPPRGQLADFDTSDAAATFNRAALAATRQLAAVTEAAIRAVATEYGIEDAAQAARDRRMVRVDGVGDRPVWVVPCDCGQDLAFLRDGSTVVNQDDIVFRTVQLRADVYTVGDQTRFVVRRGRCDGCGVVYFSVRRR